MSNMHWQAFKELMSRYAIVFRHAWQHRKELDGHLRSKDEAEFLPAALAIQEIPVSPAPHVFMRLIITFAVIALLWAIFGRMDIVAIAQGKLIPDDSVKTIQAFEPAKVAKILVEDGQKVKVGDILLELDGTATSADVERLQSEWIAARLQIARSDLLVKLISGELKNVDQEKLFSQFTQTVPEADEILQHAETAMLESEYQEYRSRILQLESEISRREAEQRTTREIAIKLSESLPLMESRIKDLEGLLEKGYYPRHQYLEEEQKRIELSRDLSAQKIREQEITANLQEAIRQKATLIAETRRAELDKRHQAQVQAASLRQELIKAQQRSRFTRLTAPIDGVVQQLAVHTVGGVVTEAQQLMIVVPEDNPLIVDAILQNKDIGFVYPGQEAIVKIETFPFTKYGTISAVVTTVSNDAIPDEKLGLIYSARLKLSQRTITVEDKIINLSPGMAVSAEVKTSKRRIIEFFLSPLMQYADESLKER